MDDMQRLQDVMNQAGVEWYKDISSRIPLYARVKLNKMIAHFPWQHVADGCQGRDPSCLEKAQNVYMSFCQHMDAYIETEQQEDSILMVESKNKVLNHFKENAVEFVQEMSACLEKEKELLFEHNKEKAQETTVLIRSPKSPQDTFLDDMEQLLKDTQDSLRRICDEFNGSESVEVHKELPQGFQTCMPSVHMESSQIVEASFRGGEIIRQEHTEERLFEQIQNDSEKAMTSLELLHQKSEFFVEELAKDVTKWKNAEAKRNVLVGPEKDPNELFTKFHRFCSVLDSIMVLFGPGEVMCYIRKSETRHHSGSKPVVSRVVELETSFRQVLNRLFEFNIIVDSQPKGVISIENKGSKENPDNFSKKKQIFRTSVRILGAECFKGSVHTFKAPEIELMSEKDLTPKSSPSQCMSSLSSKTFYEVIDGEASYQINYKDLEVERFPRLNRQVYKQFFRLRYKVSLSVFGTEHQLQTLSLPIMFSKGSEQSLEQNGARLWYIASTDDLYSGEFQCKDSLPQEELLNILNKRVLYGNKNGRPLREEEKTFLKQILPASKEGCITMEAFIKMKMKDPKDERENFKFSVNNWFLAAMHCIESPLLLSAWQDGVIFGFCSDRTAAAKLMDKKVREGTFILRPSISQLGKGNFAAITMDVKMRTEDAIAHDSHERKYRVQSVPVYIETIKKNTLYKTIDGMKVKDRKIATYLYGINRKITFLKKYGEKQPETHARYKLRMCTNETIDLSFQGGEPAGESSDQDGPEPIPRKRCYRRTNPSTSSQGISPEQPMSCESNKMEDSAIFSPMAQDMEIMDDTVKSGYSQQNFNQEFRIQSKIQSGFELATPQNQQEKKVLLSNFKKFGKTEVDTSKLCILPEVVSSSHNTDGPPDSMFNRQVDKTNCRRKMMVDGFVGTGTSWETNPSHESHNSNFPFQSSSNLPTILNEAPEPLSRQPPGQTGNGKKFVEPSKSFPVAQPCPGSSHNSLQQAWLAHGLNFSPVTSVNEATKLLR